MKDIDYASLIKETRTQLGLSQEDLARELGVSFTSINRWEKGQFKPSKLAIMQLVAFCKRMAKQGKMTLPEALK